MLHDILLEAGTNEVEFLEFYLAGCHYAINVEKVKQLLSYDPARITRVPDQNGSLLGTLHIFSRNVPIIDLAAHLKMSHQPDLEKRILIITDFNRTVIGFLVDGVNRIQRFSWDKFQPFSRVLESYRPRFTGVVVVENREILIPDFESILDDLHPDEQFLELKREIEATIPSGPRSNEVNQVQQVSEQSGKAPLDVWSRAVSYAGGNSEQVGSAASPANVSAQTAATAKAALATFESSGVVMSPSQPSKGQHELLELRHKASLLFADDSGMFRMGLVEALGQAGFHHLQVFENGLELWKSFQSIQAHAQEKVSSVDLVISDIEMPCMDGLTVCRKIKEIAPAVKVILLSSLVTEQLELKAKAVGADRAISKKNLAQLPKEIDELLKERKL